MKNDNGFSLIELMIVVAIIGVIGAIAMPSYDSYMKKGRRADAKVGLSKVADKQERYYLQNNIYAANTTLLGLADNGSGGWNTDEGYYGIKVDDRPDYTTGFDLTATAITGEAQANDTGCTTMTLSSTGAKEPNGNPATEQDCW